MYSEYLPAAASSPIGVGIGFVMRIEYVAALTLVAHIAVWRWSGFSKCSHAALPRESSVGALAEARPTPNGDVRDQGQCGNVLDAHYKSDAHADR